jgi:hypothetical protein
LLIFCCVRKEGDIWRPTFNGDISKENLVKVNIPNESQEMQDFKAILKYYNAEEPEDWDAMRKMFDAYDKKYKGHIRIHPLFNDDDECDSDGDGE